MMAELKLIPGKDLVLGFRGEHVHFVIPPYKDMSHDQQVDYLRLQADIKAYGIKKPIITYKGHVLIGMRRYEIMMAINFAHNFECFEILEDVNEWTRHDLSKIDEIKELIGEAKY